MICLEPGNVGERVRELEPQGFQEIQMQIAVEDSYS